MPNFIDYNMAPTPEQLNEIYSSGFRGVRHDRASYYALRKTVPRFYDAFPESRGAGKGRVSSPFKAALALDPEFGVYEAQTTGDCFLSDAKVTMADGGTKNITDVNIGEKVLTADNNTRVVIDTIEKDYSGDIVRLYVDKSEKYIEATPDHKVWVFKNIGNDNLDDVDEELIPTSIEDIEVGDYICISNPIDESRINNLSFDMADYCNAITEDLDFKRLRLEPADAGKIRPKGGRTSVTRHVDFDEKLGWLFGLFLAEGSIEEHRITYNLGGHEGVIAEQVRLLFKDIFDIDVNVYQVPSKPSVIYVRVYSLPIANLFKELCDGNTYSKYIDNRLKYTRKSVRLSILKGWYDGDGHRYENGRSSAVTVSEQLANDMFDIANSCGLYPTMSSRPENTDKNGVKHRKAYDVHLSAISSSIKSGNKIAIEYSTRFATEKGMAVRVKDKFNYSVDTKVYCLNVDEDHSFVCNGFAVNNCVSHSTRNAGMIDYCIDALFGETEFKGRLATENIYGWRGHGGQGASCSRLATYVSQEGPGGFLVRKAYENESGSDSVDLSRYNGSIGHNWGRRGTPDWLNKIAEQNKALRVFSIKSMEEALDAIAMGFGISMCSGYGFSSSRNEDGLCERRGGWSHAMAWIGSDDTDYAHQKYNGTLFLVQNSWGKWNNGPKRHEQPDGSFYIRPEIAESMIKGGGGWVIASVRGYNRELVYDTACRVQELGD